VWVHDSLVVNELVPFAIGEGGQLIVLWVPDNVVCVDDLGLTGFQEGLLDFVLDILTHDVVIQLGFAFAVEAETTNLALNLSVLGGVPIILGAP